MSCLTDAELKKMTSELPRRCLVEAVIEWANDNNKLILPSITRADKAEIVATIKEHRIPVPKMSGGGYYGDEMDDILTGGQIHNDVHLCRDCRMGDDDFDFIENERRTTQPYEIAGGRAIGQKSGRDDTDDTDDTDDSEDEPPAPPPAPPPPPDAPFECAECGEIIQPGTREYRGRVEIDGQMYCGYCADDVSDDVESDDDEELEGGSIPLDKALYEKAKAEVYPKFKKPSAYRSGALVKRYKELGGRYKDAPDGKRTLGRWFKEGWKDVGKKKGDYPLYRPTKRISKDTPATASEIGEKRLGEQDKLKQKYKGDKNLPAFVGSGDKEDYLKSAKAFAKKAGYKNWNNLKYATDGVHKLELDGVKFGRKGYGDFIKYGMEESPQEAQKHRSAYLARATKIKGDWKDDPMSKNNLAIKVLWGGSPFHHLRGGSATPALPPNVELVSKEESPVVEEIIEEPMDDGDIRAYYPNAKIIKYSELKKYQTITQLLPKDKSYVIILYQHAANEGHWVMLMRYGKTIEFFCSYGSVIDGPLSWTNPKDRALLGEAVPYLTNLLKAQKEFNVIHNPVQYQSKGTDKATCGAHCVMRLSQMLNHGQDLTDYYDYMSKIKKESGLSYDEIVANFVSQR